MSVGYWYQKVTLRVWGSHSGQKVACVHGARVAAKHCVLGCSHLLLVAATPPACAMLSNARPIMLCIV